MYWTIQFNAFRLLLFYLCRKSERSLFIPDIKHTSVRHFDAGIGNEPFSIRVVSAVGGVICDDKSMLGGMIAKTDVFYGNLEETTGLVHKTELPQYFGDDSIGIYVSADDVYSGEMLYTAKNLFEEDSNAIWIASLDNHMYHDLSSNTIENTMIPQDYTGIIR